MTFYLKGHKFFYRLVEKATFDEDDNSKSSDYLYKNFSEDSLFGKLVVCYTMTVKPYSNFYKDQRSTRFPNTKISDTMKLFTVFDNYIQLAMYMIKFPINERHFFEVVHSTFQKPKFDIEIDDGTAQMKDVVDQVLRGIFIVMKTYNIELNAIKDILVYNSNGPTKQSCHIVIDNWCHTDNIQSRAFYEKVVMNINPLLVKYVDNSVYSKRQQFRIIGNQKNNSNRPKNFQKVWSYYGKLIQHEYVVEPFDDKHEFMLQLAESLITNINYCTILPDFFVQDVKKSPTYSKISNYEASEVTPDIAKAAVEKLAGTVGMRSNNIKFPYRYNGIRDGIIMLKRVKPSKCQICKRTHENENPFLYVVGPELNVYFNCRRCDPKIRHFIGKLIDNGSSTALIDHTAINHSPFNHSFIDHAAINHSPVNYNALNHSFIHNTATNDSHVNHNALNHSFIDNTATNDSHVNHDALNHSPVDNTATNDSPFDNTATNDSPVDNTFANRSSVESSIHTNVNDLSTELSTAICSSGIKIEDRGHVLDKIMEAANMSLPKHATKRKFVEADKNFSDTLMDKFMTANGV